MLWTWLWQISFFASRPPHFDHFSFYAFPRLLSVCFLYSLTQEKNITFKMVHDKPFYTSFLFFLTSSNISQYFQIGPWLRDSEYLVWVVITWTKLSSPHAERALAVSGRRSPHSGEGKDFLTGQPDFFTETAVTPEQKVEKSIPRWEMNRHSEGYK